MEQRQSGNHLMAKQKRKKQKEEEEEFNAFHELLSTLK